MDIRQLVAWVGTSMTLKTMSLLDTFKIAFASALPAHATGMVLEAIDLILGDDKNRTMEYYTAKKVVIDGTSYQKAECRVTDFAHLTFYGFSECKRN
nr:hypothetical protein [Escherichia coli]